MIFEQQEFITDLIVFRALHPSAVVLLSFSSCIPARKKSGLSDPIFKSCSKGTQHSHPHRLLVRHCYTTVLKATAQH